MTKVATYDDLLAEIEAQQAYIAQLEQEREALQKQLAELQAKQLPETALTPAQREFISRSATEEGRVPLMEGYYVRDIETDEAKKWLPDANKAVLFCKDTQYCASWGPMAALEKRIITSGLAPADFIPLREAYYAQ